MHNTWLIASLEFFFEMLCCLFAILKGGSAERAGALVVVACYVVTEIVIALSWPHFPITVVFILDFVLAIGLLVVAFRFGSLWLGFAMLLQSANLCSQAFAFTGDGLSHSSEVILNNVLSLLMGGSIAMGAFFSWRKRERARLASQAVGTMASSPPT
ncbi:hypothetical protein [Caulobacter sp. S45]|uniref:hypothetical protein n=1 Tax=Caulobacter sp. S45 TaxID=1641861 RepID=UPI00131DB2D8|nr:hypothetical protein [Caulobacter sp. S45]